MTPQNWNDGTEDYNKIFRLKRQLQEIREAFDALLIAEVHAYGGIPAWATTPEQAAFREQLATLLKEDGR